MKNTELFIYFQDAAKKLLDSQCPSSGGGTMTCLKGQICCARRAGNPCCNPNQEDNCCGGGTNAKAPKAPSAPSAPKASPASTGRQSDDKSSARKVFGSLQFQCVTLIFAFLLNIVM